MSMENKANAFYCMTEETEVADSPPALSALQQFYSGQKLWVISY